MCSIRMGAIGGIPGDSGGTRGWFLGTATETLAHLLVVTFLLSLVLTQTSENVFGNLPVALLLAWAVRYLAQVRFDARWDAKTRQFHFSVTRHRLGHKTKAPRGGPLAGGPEHVHQLVDGRGKAPRGGGELASSASPGDPIGAGGGVRRAGNSGPRDVVAGMKAMGPPSIGISPWQPSEREVELRELLRGLEQQGRDTGVGNGADTKPNASLGLGGDSEGKAYGVTVLSAWGRLRDHIVDEYVTSLWYRTITEDEDLPLALRRLLDACFAELAYRARAVDLPTLLLRRVPDILTQQLEAFRGAREAAGGVDAFVRLTPEAADRAVADELRRRGQLHPGVDMRPAESAGRSGTSDPVDRVLARACQVAAVALLPPDVAASPVLFPLMRELLACAVLKPLLGFASPLWVHRGLAYLLVPREADDEWGSAEKGDDVRALAAKEMVNNKEMEKEKIAVISVTSASDTSSSASNLTTRPADCLHTSPNGVDSSDDDNNSPQGERRLLHQQSPHCRSLSLTDLGRHPCLAPSEYEEEGGREDEEHKLSCMIKGNEDVDHDDIGLIGGGRAVAVAEAHHALSMSMGDVSTGTGTSGSMPATVQGNGGVVGDGQNIRVHARVSEVNIVGKGTGAYAVYTIRVHNGNIAGEDEIIGGHKIKNDWAVARRFRNFEALHRRLVEAGWDSLPQLPKKRYLLHSLDGSFVEARRRLLDTYLTAILDDTRFCGCSDVQDFLNDESGAYALKGFGGSWDNWRVVGSMSGSWSAGGVGVNTVTGDGGGRSVGQNKHRRNMSLGTLPFRGTSDLRAAPQNENQQARVTGETSVGCAAVMDRGIGATKSVTKEKVGVEVGLEVKKTEEEEKEESQIRPQAEGGGERFEQAAAEPSNSSSTQILMNGSLLGLFEAVFQLKGKGLVRRTIVTVVRQTLEFFVGSAVEDLVASKFRALRTPNTVARCIDFIDVTLWPGGEWYQRVVHAMPSTSSSATNSGPVTGGKGCVNGIVRGEESRIVDPATSAAAASAARAEAAAKEELDIVRLKVRDALLSIGSRGPVPGLLGTRNFTRAAHDVLAIANSELMMRQIGLLLLEAALESLFTKLQAHGDPSLQVASQGNADVDGKSFGT